MKISDKTKEDIYDFMKCTDNIELSWEDEMDKTYKGTCYLKYPLSVVAEFPIEFSSMEELWEKVRSAYEEIYKEEEESSSVTPGLIPNMYNRNRTNGKFGIWGHGINDLVLESVIICEDKIIPQMGS